MSDMDCLTLKASITLGGSSNSPDEGTPHQVRTDESASSRNLLNTLISIFKLVASRLHPHLRNIARGWTSGLAREHALKVPDTDGGAPSKYLHRKVLFQMIGNPNLKLLNIRNE
jgi:hypothetical protein